PRAQDRRRRAHATTKPAVKTRKRNLPLLPPPVITRRGGAPHARAARAMGLQTTIRRYANRSLHRMEQFKCQTVAFVEFFTCSGYHSVAVRFQDKTSLHIIIDPGFTLEADYSDWKTGNWRPLKRWPRVRSASFNS